MKFGSGMDLRRLLSMLVTYGASSGSLIAANLAQLVTFAILARSFGAEEFGRYVAVIAVTSIAVHLCGLGAPECLVRRVAQDRASYPRILGHNLVLTLASGAVLVLVGTAFLPLAMPLAPDPWTNTFTAFLLVTTNVLLVRLVTLSESVYLGHSMFSAANASVVGFAAARLLAAALACTVFGVNNVVDWALWQFAAHVAVILVYSIFVLRLGRPRLTVVREELRLGVLFATPLIFRAIKQNADIMVLGMVAGAEVVGSYGLARRIVDSSYMAIDALNRLVYPTLAVASREGIHKAQALTMRILGAALLLGLSAAMVIFLAAPWLPLLFGPEYVSLPTFCRIMAGAIVLVAAWSVAIDLLGAAGEHGRRALVLNASNGAGALLMGVAAWFWPPEGVFVATYIIEFSILVLAWTTLLTLSRRSRALSTARMVQS